jgi:uncharacterized protein
LTENAVLRILGQPRYPNSPGTPATVAKILKSLRDQPGHEFWGDDISMMDGKYVSPQSLVTSAVCNGAKGLKLLG